jgi:hypothetical protein
MKIYCCGCKKYVIPRLTTGREIYPHRENLHRLKFYKCDTCNNYVGTHKNSVKKIIPLGNISTSKLRNLRMQIHNLIDPIWKSGKMKRKDLYKKISQEIGWEYHTAKIRSADEAEKIITILKKIGINNV